MVDVAGHFAVALLWVVPVWVVWEDRLRLPFVGLALAAAMLPDVDLVLSGFLPVTHHGVTHTVLFVAAVAVAAGGLVASVGRPRLEHRWLEEEEDELPADSLFVFAASGVLVGGCSHLFADMLSAPDIAPPVEPFWPFFDKPWSVDVLWYNDPVWNAGLLGVAVALHLLAWRLAPTLNHRYRVRTDS